MLSVFVSEIDFSGDAAQHRCLFWKVRAVTPKKCCLCCDVPTPIHGAGSQGHDDNDRTPSAWLLPRSNKVTFRVSTHKAAEAWGTSSVAIPSRAWTHLAVVGAAGGRAWLYVDGALDTAVAFNAPLRANSGPLHVGRGWSHGGGFGGLIADFSYRPEVLPAAAIADAIATFQVGRHRSEVVAIADGITYVDDSKATNPHAAEASVSAYARVVWVAGGLLKGASVDAEVARMASRLVGAVLIGRDRGMVAEALSRHAPDVPVVEVGTSEDIGVDATAEVSDADVTKEHSAGEKRGYRVMTAAVAAARNLAKPGDTVLLAPAGASFDQFSGYADRGDAFAAAVRSAIR